MKTTTQRVSTGSIETNKTTLSGVCVNTVSKNPKANELRRRTAIVCAGGRTKQAFKDECDINTIIGRYRANGQLPDLIKQDPKFGDFASVPSYQDSLNLVLHANEQFAALPSNIRARFQNDPAQFLEFATNPKNMDEMVKMGLATPRQQSNDDVTQQPKNTPSVQKKGTKTPDPKPSEDSSDE